MAEKKRDERGQKLPGYFSWRHQSSVAHEANHKMWEDERSPAVRGAQAEARQAERSSRTPDVQLALLDKRLGVGHGAKKERARLSALLGQK